MFLSCSPLCHGVAKGGNEMVELGDIYSRQHHRFIINSVNSKIVRNQKQTPKHTLELLNS